MSSLAEIIARLDEINRAVTGYDPVLKESACNILLARAFPRPGNSAQEPSAEPAPPTRPRRRAARSFAGLLGQWGPSKPPQQALLAVYFLTRRGDADGTSTRAVTALLKENGVHLTAPTPALLANTTRTPALLSATKTGESKQARQVFQLTPAGEAYVRSRLEEDA